ncbi:MAG: ATP synthase subunit I [Deltaproteobacteria bacterium]|nr:ATP synthase subunit I [Deltaproteobacteria bacterium]
MERGRFLNELKKSNWVTLMVLGALSFFFMKPMFTLGVILGGLTIIANFGVLQHTIYRAFSDQGAMKAKKMVLIGKYYFRLAITGLIIYIVITNGLVDPIGLAIGLSTVVISIVNIGIRSLWRTTSREAI